MAAADDSDLSEQPSSSPSAGSTVPLPSSEVGSPTGDPDRNRATSPRPEPSVSRPAKTSAPPARRGSKPVVGVGESKSSSSAAHSRHNSASTIKPPNRRKGKPTPGGASSSRAGSLATEGRASSVKAESVQSPTSRDGSLAPLSGAPTTTLPSKMSRVSSLADSPSPPHHLNTSHGELPLFEQPIILEGGRSRRTAPPLPPPAPASATRKKAGSATMAAAPPSSKGESTARRKLGESPGLSTKNARGGPARGKKRDKKADATDGDSSLTEQDSLEDAQEESASSSLAIGKRTKRRRALVDETEEDGDEDGRKPNGNGKAKAVESATSTSLSEAGSDTATPATVAPPLTIGAGGPSVTTTTTIMGSAKRPSGSTSSSSTSIPMRNVHRSPHAALFQGETERWGLPPGEGRARRGAATAAATGKVSGRSKLGKSEPAKRTSPSISGRSSRGTGGVGATRGSQSKRRRVESDSDDDEDEDEDLTVAAPVATALGDVEMVDAPATPSRAGDDDEEAEAAHFAIPRTMAVELESSRPPSAGTDEAEGEDEEDEDEAGPSPPTPLREEASGAESETAPPMVVGAEGEQKEEEGDEDEEAVKTLAGLGMVMDDDRAAAVDALQSLVDAATGSAEIVGPGEEDQEEEEEGDEEEDEAGEKAGSAQVAAVDASSPAKARQARVSPELTDAQDAYNVKRTEATDRLARIEIAFAALRNRLYVERTADVLREKAAVEAGVHPELNAYVEMLQHKRERRLEQARKRFDAREQALARRKTASEAAIWTMWNEAKVGSRNAMVAQTHREIRQLEREKGQPEILRTYVESQLAPREILPGAPSVLSGGRRRRTAEEREAEEEEDLAVALRFAVAGRAAADLSSLTEEDRVTDLRRMAMRPAAGMDPAQAARETAEITSLYGTFYPVDPMLSYAMTAAAVSAPVPHAPEPTAPHPPSQHAGPRPTADSEKKHHRRPTLDTVMQQERPPRPSSFNPGPPAFYVPAMPPNPIRQY